VNEGFSEFDCLEHLGIDKRKLEGRHAFHKRSYLDMKLRLSDHLVADHGDRVAYANSIEGRYPFLDVNLAIYPEGSSKKVPAGRDLCPPETRLCSTR